MITEERINKLEKDLAALKAEYYSTNFSARQDFYKFSDFKTRLKIPHYATLPATCEVGEIAEASGKLNICSAANTWVVAGTQT